MYQYKAWHPQNHVNSSFRKTSTDFLNNIHNHSKIIPFYGRPLDRSKLKTSKKTIKIIENEY